LSHAFPRSFESVLSWSRILYNLRKLRRNSWLSSSKLEEMQNKGLREVVKYAYENVAFYHQAFNRVKIKASDIRSVDDLLKIPTVTKSEVQKNSKSLIAKGVALDQCTSERTSGSTGVPLAVFAQKNASYLLKANKLRHYVENGGSLLRDKFVLIGLRRLPDSRTNVARSLNRLGIYRSTRMCLQDPIEEVLEQLVNFEPDVIKAPASILMLLAAEMEKSGKKVRPKFVWSNGELVDSRSRRLINSAFEVEMLDGYACVEAGYVAWECSEHAGYHINKDLVVVEFVKDGEHAASGESGEIILTPLWNYAMPLIRYRVGDVGTPSDESCPCGRGMPLMKVIEGRLDDFIVLPSGRIISPIVLLSVFDKMKGIAEFRIIQEKQEELTVRIALKDGDESDVLSKLRGRFADRLRESMKLNIEVVDAVATEREQDKPRCIVSKCMPREHFFYGG